jgi:hypothetical protein
VKPLAAPRARFALGKYGQYIYVVPGSDLVRFGRDDPILTASWSWEAMVEDGGGRRRRDREAVLGRRLLLTGGREVPPGQRRCTHAVSP